MKQHSICLVSSPHVTDSLHELMNICQLKDKNTSDSIWTATPVVLSLMGFQHPVCFDKVCETRTGVSKLFYKVPNRCFRLQRPHDLSHSYSTLLL